MDEIGDTGLRSLRLGTSDFRERTTEDPDVLLDLSDTTLEPVHRSLEQIVGEVLLKEGVGLDATWTRAEAGGSTVITADGVSVVLSVEITETVAAEALDMKPRVVVFLEDGFAGRDAVKANAFTNAKNLGITMKTV